MTTVTWSTVIDHTSDAGFRAWGSELGVKFAAAGLVQTSDTGQINWASVLRPGVSTVGGYEIWRFADSSLYLKIEYGTDTSAAVPKVWLTVGTGSNGSGTLTGQLNTRFSPSANLAISSTSTAYPSYLCVTADYFGLAWKYGAGSGRGYMFWAVGKSVDSSGAVTTTGYGVLMSVSGSDFRLQCVRTAATARTFILSKAYCCFPGDPTDSLVGTDIQAYMCWMNMPQVTPYLWCCGVLIIEITQFNTFSVAMVGSTAHTYLTLGKFNASGVQQVNNQGSDNYTLAMLWE